MARCFATQAGALALASERLTSFTSLTWPIPDAPTSRPCPPKSRSSCTDLRYSTTDVCFFLVAALRGEVLLLLILSGSALAETSAFTISRCPSSAALMTGVHPFFDALFTSAPASMRACTTSRWLFCEAMKIGVLPDVDFSLLGSAPPSMRLRTT